MAEGKKYVVVAREMYEMLLIKGETPANPIASTVYINCLLSVKASEAAGERCSLQNLFLNNDRTLSWNFYS